MIITIRSTATSAVSTDLGMLYPAHTLSEDLSPEEVYESAPGLHDLETKGLITVTVSEDPSIPSKYQAISTTTLTADLALKADAAATTAALALKADAATTTAALALKADAAATTAALALKADDATTTAALALKADAAATTAALALKADDAATTAALALKVNTADLATTTVGVATKLETARTINGVSFDGTANVSVPVLDFFSTEQTGTGAAQDLAHGLATVPVVVLVVPTDSTAASPFVTSYTADGTNVSVTATAGLKYRVWAR